MRKIAAEHGLDISTIAGSGMAGRVTKNDVIAYIESPPAAAAPAAAPVPAASPALAPAAAASAPAAAPGYPAADPWEGDRIEPWSRIRKLTAEHMIMSRRTSAHVATFFEIDYSRVATLRAKKKAEYAERGVNLTFLAFIAKAVADSLRKHPVVNAAVGHETTIYRRDINLGIAVALDWGLIVPVIKHADELSMLGLARSISDLADRARSKKLSPDEVQKGTFTITNPGVFGSTIGIPIINQPQVAILAVGSITKQPAVMTVDGSDTLDPHQGPALAVVRSPGRGRLGCRQVHGGREEGDRDVRRGRGVAVGRALTVARSRRPGAAGRVPGGAGRARGDRSPARAAPVAVPKRQRSRPVPEFSEAARWSTTAPSLAAGREAASSPAP